MSMTERKTETGQAQAFQVSFKILGQMAKATVGKKSAKGSLSPITTAAGAVQILPSQLIMLPKQDKTKKSSISIINQTN